MATASSGNGKLVYADYCLAPSDGRRYEVLDGDIFMNPAPGTAHQTASKRLLHEFYTQIELAGLGLVFDAPFDVELAKHDIVQPDLIVLLEKNRHLLKPSRIIGVPDLLVEILSPSNSDYDQKAKRAVYQRVGVPEYWIVDPVDRRLKQLVLRNGRYTCLKAAAIVRPAKIDGVGVEVAKLW